MSPALLTAVDSTSHVHLIIGSNPLAGARCSRSLEVGAIPKLIAPSDADEIHYGLKKRIDDGQVEWLKREFQDDDLQRLGRQEVDHIVDAVFVTLGRRDPLSLHISSLCRRLRIPVNVADAPNLCTFTLLSTYSDGPLQIGITTSGKGCKLASRIRREVVSSLPAQLGAACERLGTVRRRIWEEDHAADLAYELEGEEDDGAQKATFNQLISGEDRDAARNRRMRWLGQICEYWPLSRLAAINDEDVDTILHSYTTSGKEGGSSISSSGLRGAKGGQIILAGSGPGHPDLLTTATHKAIQTADLILADKLVPSAVLDLAPRRATLYIARKFPGNADKAQEELLQLGLAGLQAGQIVVRLKQGDPYIYGRGAEEYAFFAGHGFRPVVLPGITSALSAPLFAGIPPTHRAVADQVLVCTGTGRKGVAPTPPEYVPSRTVVFLMALHRLGALVESLLLLTKDGDGDDDGDDDGVKSGWPRATPCAVIERASCPDQRVIRSSLEYICAAVEEEGSRPPGLLVVGESCGVLHRKEEFGQKWIVEEGFRGLVEAVEDGGMETIVRMSKEEVKV
ncbi:MAG: hypothetical protein M1816_004038 [Peltula sp. TS41687]|nr:MAG: hypothetical protein M1816_004038 [Peltula sp. TS41687]